MTDEAITTVLSLIKEALFTFGAEGDECIQKLVSVEAGLKSGDARSRVFHAFHEGLAGQEATDMMSPLPPWPGDPALRAAYETGSRSARLNALFREKNLSNGWNVGPLDSPALRHLLTQLTER